MKTGTEVARITVKVSPDTTKFREELKRKLEAIEKGLGDNTKTDLGVDTKPAEKKVNKAGNKMSKDLGKKFKLRVSKDIRDSIADLNKISGKFDLDTTKFDLSKLPKDINKSINALNKQGGVIDLFKYDDDGKAEVDRLAKDMSKKLDVINLRWDEKMRDWKLGPSLKKEITGLRAEFERVNAEMDVAKQKANSAASEIYRVFRFSDKKTIRSALRDYALGFRDIDYQAQKARETTEKLGSAWGKKFGIHSGRDQLRARGGLTGALLGGAGAITALKGATEVIKGMGKAVSVLPGMFGDAGSAFGKFFGKVKSFGGAIKPSFGTGINLAGYAAILGAITLVAAPLIGIVTSALLTLPGLLALVTAPIGAVVLGLDGLKEAATVLKEPFEELKTVMSDSFKQQFTPVFEQLKGIFPTLKQSMPSIVTGLKDMAQELTNLFTSDQGKTVIAETVEGIGAALTNMAPGVRDFTAAIMELAHEFVTGGALEGVGDWFTDTMADFRNWVETEDLTAMFSGLGDTLKIILDLLGAWAKQGLDFIGDPSKMDGFLSTLQNIADVLEDLVDLSNTLAGVWDFITAPMDALGQTVDYTSDFLRSVPLVGDLWDSFLPDDWTTLGEKAKEAGTAAMTSFMNGLRETQDAGIEGGLMLGTGWTEGIDEHIGEITQDIASAGEEWRQTLEDAVSGDQVDTAVAEQINAKVTAAVTGANQALQPLKENLQNDIDNILAPLGDIAGRAGVAFDQLGQQMGSVVEGILPTVQTAFANVGSGAVDKMVEELGNGTGRITGAVEAWPPAVEGALAPLATVGATVANQLVTGLAIGINNGIPSVTAAARSLASAAKAAAEAELGINSPSRVFRTIGEQTGEGMQIGLQNGFQPVLDTAKDLAGKISDIMSVNGDPTVALQGYSNKDVDRIEKVLAFESKRMGLQTRLLDRQYKATGDEGLKARSDEIKAMQEQMSLQREMISLSQEFAELQNPSKSSGGSHPFIESIKELMKLPNSFADATRNQFMQDLGISGNGALPAVADWAMGAASNFIFNVSNVDEAIAVKNNQINKQSMQFNS